MAVIDNIINFFEQTLKSIQSNKQYRKLQLDDLQNTLRNQIDKLRSYTAPLDIEDPKELLKNYLSSSNIHGSIQSTVEQALNAIKQSGIKVRRRQLEQAESYLQKIQKHEGQKQQVQDFASLLAEIGVKPQELELSTYPEFSEITNKQLLYDKEQQTAGNVFKRFGQLRKLFYSIQSPQELFYSPEQAKASFLSQFELLVKTYDLPEEKAKALLQKAEQFAKPELFETGIDLNVLIPAANPETLVKKSEKLGLTKTEEGVEVTSVTDVVKQMIGLKSKSTTGIATDTQLGMQLPFIGLSDTMRELTLYSKLQQALKSESTEQFEKAQKTQFPDIPELYWETGLMSRLREQQKANDIQSQYKVLFENIEDIQPEHREQYRQYAENVFGAFAVGRILEETKVPLPELQNVGKMTVGAWVEDKVSRQTKTQEYILSQAKRAGGTQQGFNAEAFYNLWLEKEKKLTPLMLQVMQSDVQKTVNKQNTNIIIQPFLNLITDRNLFQKISEPETMQNIMTSVYNAFYKQQDLFKQEQLTKLAQQPITKKVLERLPQEMQPRVSKTLENMLEAFKSGKSLQEFTSLQSGEDIKNLSVWFVATMNARMQDIYEGITRLNKGAYAKEEQKIFREQFGRYLQLSQAEDVVDIGKVINIKQDYIKRFAPEIGLSAENMRPSDVYLISDQFNYVQLKYGEQLDETFNIKELAGQESMLKLKNTDENTFSRIKRIVSEYTKRKKVELNQNAYLNVLRTLRGHKGASEQFYQATQKNRQFGKLLKEGLIKRLKMAGVEDYLRAGEVLSIPSKLESVRYGILSQAGNTEEAKRMLLEAVEALEEKPDIASDEAVQGILEELEDLTSEFTNVGEHRNTFQHSDSYYRIFTTGAYIPLGESGTGGLLLMPGGQEGELPFRYDYSKLSNMASYFFSSPKKAIQQQTQFMGSQYRHLERAMYQATNELGVPFGIYSRIQQSELKPGRIRDIFYKFQEPLFDEMALKQLDITNRGAFSFKTFDLFRGIVQQSKFQEKPTSRFKEFREKVLSLLTPDEIRQFVNKGWLGGNRVPHEEVLKLLESRIVEKFGSQQEFVRTQQRFINYSLKPKALANATADIDLDFAVEYLSAVHKTRFAGQTVQLQPTSFLDPISLASANDIGSVATFRSLGQNQSQIQNMLNPQQNITDPIRAITTYQGKAPLIQLNKPKNLPPAGALGNLSLDKIQKYMQDKDLQFWFINRKPLLSVDQPFASYFGSEENKANELAFGFYAFTAQLDKDDQSIRKILNAIGGADLELAGDAYFASDAIRKMVSLLQYTESGKVQKRQLPDMYKLTGVARSKGMVTLEYSQNLYAKLNIGDREMFVPIHMIMNTQGKRKNKMAEFGMSMLRMQNFKNELLGKSQPMSVDTQQYSKLNRFVSETVQELNKLPAGKQLSEEDLQQVIQQKLSESFNIQDENYQRYIQKNVYEDIKGILGKEQDISLDIADSIMRHILSEPTDKQLLESFSKTQLGKISKEMYAGFAQQQELYVYREGKMQSLGVSQPIMIEKMFVDTSKDFASKIQGQSVFYVQTLPLQSVQETLTLNKMQLLGDRQGSQQLQKIQSFNLHQMIQQQTAQSVGMEEIERAYRRGGETSSRAARLLHESFEPFKSFLNVKQQDYTMNKQLQLVKFQNKLQGTGIQELQKTQELLNILSGINPEQDVVSKKLSAVPITKQQAKQLAGMTGEIVYLPQPFLNFAGKAQWTENRNILFLQEQIKKLQESGNLVEFEYRGRKAPMFKIKLPALVSIKNNMPTLSMDAETLYNVFSSFFTATQHIQATGLKRDLGETVEHQGFFAGRIASLAKQYSNQYLQSITKKHGQQFYQIHSTARSDLGGVNVPRKLVTRLLTQQHVAGYLQAEDLPTNIRDTIVKAADILRQDERLIAKATEKVERFVRQAVYYTTDESGEVVAYLSPEQKSLVSAQGMRRQLKGIMPNIKLSNVRFAGSSPEESLWFKRNVLLEFQKFASDAFERQKAIQQGISTHPNRIATSYAGELWGVLTRHPVIGHQPIVKLAGFSQKDTIEVPQAIAEQIAGDDDGDMISLLPNIIIEEKVFATGKQERNKLGVWDIAGYSFWQQSGQHQQYAKEMERYTKMFLGNLLNK